MCHRYPQIGLICEWFLASKGQRPSLLDHDTLNSPSLKTLVASCGTFGTLQEKGYTAVQRGEPAVGCPKGLWSKDVQSIEQNGECGEFGDMPMWSDMREVLGTEINSKTDCKFAII
jgi:hypothetical protein